MKRKFKYDFKIIRYKISTIEAFEMKNLTHIFYICFMILILYIKFKISNNEYILVNKNFLANM